jgi:hypothetical protein
MSNKKLDLVKFFKHYTHILSKPVIKKSSLLEEFKRQEDLLSQYSKALSELEKLKNDIGFALFDEEIKKFLYLIFKEFDVTTMEANIAFVRDSTAYLINKERDISNSSDRYKGIKKFWEKYKAENNLSESSSKLIQEIERELSNIEDKMKRLDFNELTRFNDDLIKLNENIKKSVQILTKIKNIIEKNIFIGDTGIELYNKIKIFIEKEYRNSTLEEISIKSKKIEQEFESVKVNSSLITKQFPVYKVLARANKKGVYSYAFKTDNGLYLNLSETQIKNPEYVFIDRYIYVENYPNDGVFDIDFLESEMDIGNDYINAMIDFEVKTSNIYLFFIVLSIITNLSAESIGGFIPTLYLGPILVLYWLSFVFMFKYTKRKNDEQYGFKQMFHFFGVNYIFVKEGDSLADLKKVKYNLHKYFNQIFKLPKEEIKLNFNTKGVNNESNNS